MPYGETKVYFDGSHFIAIPHTERPTKRRPKPPEEIITVTETPQETIQQSKDESAVTDDVIAPIPLVKGNDEQVAEQADSTPQTVNDSPKNERKTTRKELFNKLYQDSLSVKKSERRKRIITAMLPYFKDETETAYYVDRNLERK